MTRTLNWSLIATDDIAGVSGQAARPPRFSLPSSRTARAAFSESPLFERPSAGQARHVEPIQQAGLALVLCAQYQEPFRERGGVALPVGERPQVPQQRHGQVVVAWPLRLPGFLPRGLAVPGRLPQPGSRPGRYSRLRTTSRPEAAQQECLDLRALTGGGPREQRVSMTEAASA